VGGASGGDNTRTGVYALGYSISDPTGQYGYRAPYAGVVFSDNPATATVPLVYYGRQGADPTPLSYLVTNDLSGGTDWVWDSNWNTKEAREGGEANRLTNARYKDGRFIFTAWVWDIGGNSEARSRNVIVDNFKPKVREFEVLSEGSSLDNVGKIDDTLGGTCQRLWDTR